MTNIFKQVRNVTILIGVAAFSIAACSNNKETKSELNNNLTPAEKTETAQATIERIKVLDSSLYNASFLAALNEEEGEFDLFYAILVRNNDTLYFPVNFAQETLFTFTGTTRNGGSLKLTVTRKNLTDLDYTFTETLQDGKVSINMKGTALLSPKGFLHGNEMDEDEINEESYPSFEYIDDNYPDRTFHLRMGGELDINGQHRAKVHISGSRGPILELEDCPTLKTSI